MSKDEPKHKVTVIPEEYFEGLDPEDDGDLWRGMKRYFKAKNAQRLEANTAALSTANGWTQHTEYHFSRNLNGLKLDYWPSKDKWRWNNKTVNGTYAQLLGFISKRERPRNG